MLNSDQFIYRAQDWAIIINRSPRTVYRWLELGKIPPPDFTSSGEQEVMEWTRSTVLVWLEKRTIRKNTFHASSEGRQQ